MGHTEHYIDNSCSCCTDDDFFVGECIDCGETVDVREHEETCPHCGERHAIGEGYADDREDFHSDV